MSFYTTEECATFIRDYIWTNRATLTPNGGDPLEAAYGADQRIVPKYPAVMVVPGAIERVLVQTGMQVELILRVAVYVMHGRLSKTNTQRTVEDLKMARNIVNLLHANQRLDGNVITGMVENEAPGAMPGPSNSLIKGTRLLWRAQQREHIWQT